MFTSLLLLALTLYKLQVFHEKFLPIFNIGGVWSSLSIIPIKTLSVPLTNTVFLLTSGATVVRAKKHSLIALIITLILALLFTGLQIFEYYNAPFTISVGVFGSCFHLTTRFHVFVGTISMFVSFIRFVVNHYTDTHYFEFESGI